MKTIDLKVQVREALGKKAAKQVRREGKVPAILYGRGLKPTPLAVDVKEFHRATHTRAAGNILIGLKVEAAKGKKDTPCVIKEVQRDPVTDAVWHVDFNAVSLTEKIQVKVPLLVKDTEQSIGVKEGGILDVVHHEIEVACLPTAIPERFEVSVKELKIGDAIHLKELSFPEGVTPLPGPEEVIVALHPPRKEEEIAPPPAEAPTEPEVIEKGKKEKPEEAVEGAPAEKLEKAAPKPEKKEAEKKESA